MAISEPLTIATLDAVRALARRLDGAAHRDKGGIVAEFAQTYGWSTAKVYAELKRVGWTSGRKKRADAGTTKQDMEALTHLSSTLRLGVRKNGKATMHTPNARSLLAGNGLTFAVSNSRINQLLRERQMDLATQQQPKAHVSLRSLHPNHVHQVDPSLCLLYYSPDGKQRVLRDDEIYKNKPAWVEKVGNLKCWRYVLTDHYSGTIMVRYYQARGETQENLYDFLLWCWGRLEGRPFHGVPKMLVADKCSVNTAGPMRNAMQSMGVEMYTHKAKNARAKGQVEGANNIVETHFESRLLYEPVTSVDEMNAAAEAWMNAWNANAIPHFDSRLNRRGMAEPVARYALWQTIRQEHLRLLPDIDVCRYLLSADPEERTVAADLTVRFRHPVTKRTEFYDVSHVPGIYPRCRVRVSPLVYGGAQVLVHIDDYQGEEHVYAVTPIEYDERAGFRVDAAIIGQEFKSQPDTVADQAGKAADRAAFPGKTQDEIEKAKDKNAAPFGGLDAHSHLKDAYLPSYMPRPGTELEVPNRHVNEVKPLSHIEAMKIIARRLGQALTREQNTAVRELYPLGVPEQELDQLIERLQHGDRASSRPGLAVVNGGKVS